MLPENDIQKNVLEEIRKGAVLMRPRIYFILRAALIGIAAFVLLLAALFILSFIFFSIRESGVQFLLEFSEQGLATFVTLFPWLTLLIVFALFVLLEALLRNFSFGYRLPLLRIFLWLLVVGLVGSTLLGFTPLHTFLLSKADNGELPLLGNWYESIHDSHQDKGVYRGAVTSIAPSYFTISHSDNDRDTDEGTWSIIPPDGFDLGQLSIGDTVYVAARVRGATIYAYGIRILPKDE